LALRVVVTGAAGFVASALLERLLALPALAGNPIDEVIAVDIGLTAASSGRLVALAGDISDASLRQHILSLKPDVVFHLAALPSGASAADPARGWAVNVDATFALIQGLAAQAGRPRLVFSSSIGVFGVPLPKDKVDDETLPLPTMSYGTHKLIAEAVITDFSRRGLIEGLAVRLSGIVARPTSSGGHVSGYMSDIFQALAAGQPFVSPVSRASTSWFMSRPRIVDNLIHAAEIPGERIGARRGFNLPTLRLSIGEVVEAISQEFGVDGNALMRYEPKPEVEAQFGTYPPIFTPLADSLGFRNDGDARQLVRRALGRDGKAGSNT
jgi:nucleoside-diphosphate-sugar epimerase